MRQYNPTTGKPLQTAREYQIERLIRRLRRLVFDPDVVKADKAYDLLGRCKLRLRPYWVARNQWRERDHLLPSWVTKADFL